MIASYSSVQIFSESSNSCVMFILELASDFSSATRISRSSSAAVSPKRSNEGEKGSSSLSSSSSLFRRSEKLHVFCRLVESVSSVPLAERFPWIFCVIGLGACSTLDNFFAEFVEKGRLLSEALYCRIKGVVKLSALKDDD